MYSKEVKKHNYSRPSKEVKSLTKYKLERDYNGNGYSTLALFSLGVLGANLKPVYDVS